MLRLVFGCIIIWNILTFCSSEILFERCSRKQLLSSWGFQLDFIERLSSSLFLHLKWCCPCFTVSSWHVISKLVPFKKSLPIVEARCCRTAVFCSAYHSAGWTIQRATPANSAVSTFVSSLTSLTSSAVSDVPESGIMLWQGICHPMALGFEMILKVTVIGVQLSSNKFQTSSKMNGFTGSFTAQSQAFRH